MNGDAINKKNELLPDTLSYPRTGKRGVPQQFPRRLYTMLESESNVDKSDDASELVIQWSNSGQAFRITDIDKFSSHILPKYFRTSKFSSFQRNLNLVSWSLLLYCTVELFSLWSSESVTQEEPEMAINFDVFTYFVGGFIQLLRET